MRDCDRVRLVEKLIQVKVGYIVVPAPGKTEAAEDRN